MKHDISQNMATFSPRSITPSGHFGNSKDNIVEILDAITEEEKNILFNWAKANKNFDETKSEYNEDGNLIYQADIWENRVVTVDTFEKHSPEIKIILDEIISRLKITIDNFFNVKTKPTGACIVKWPVGSRQEPHADKEMHEGPDVGKPNAFPWYDIGTVFYLNDDYEGGELYFPELDWNFKPKADTLLMFPSTSRYIHGVNKVTKGTRYTVACWYTNQYQYLEI